MQARCPHCSTVFATERSGIQFCPNCGKQVNVPQPAEGTGASQQGGAPQGAAGPFAPLPAGGPSGAAPARVETPWERRAQLGFFPALFETWKRSLFSPEEFWSSVKPDGNWVDALLYGWLVGGVGAVFSGLMQLLNLGSTKQLAKVLGDLLKDASPEVQRAIEAMGARGGLGTALGVVAGTIVFYPLSLFIGAAVIHLFCLICGCGKNGYFATFRALAYSCGPAIFSWIPCVGVAAVIYQVVLEVWAVARLQDSTPLRAAMAVVVIPLGLVCCCCGVGSVGAYQFFSQNSLRAR